MAPGAQSKSHRSELVPTAKLAFTLPRASSDPQDQTLLSATSIPTPASHKTASSVKSQSSCLQSADPAKS